MAGSSTSSPVADAVAASAWAQRLPGLPEQASRLLDRLPELLGEAHRRGDGILRASPAAPTSVLRIGQLVGGAGPELVTLARRRDGDALVKALARLSLRGGPTYVKLGQLISSTRGVAPEWVADAFAGCRDAVPPASTAAVARTLREAGIEDHLRSWNRTPLASASVAQVHEAVLDDGREVVLKVRRPGIVGTVAADASLLLPVLELAQRLNERLRLANLRGAVELMVRLFAEEVDLRLEAANIVEMALALERSGQDLHVPAPIPGLVTKRAVALERVDGVSAASVEEVAAFGHPPEELVRLAIGATLTTTLIDGIFHGDLHLGNVLVTPSGLSLIDFGIVGRLSDQQRDALVRLLLAAVREDRSAAFAALRDFGALPADADLAALEARLPPPLSREERAALFDGPEGGEQDAIAERVSTFVRALSSAGFSVPPELTLFAKNLVYLGDAVLRHAPDIDLGHELAGAVTHLAGRVGTPATVP